MSSYDPQVNSIIFNLSGIESHLFDQNSLEEVFVINTINYNIKHISTESIFPIDYNYMSFYNLSINLNFWGKIRNFELVNYFSHFIFYILF